ncbi:MAG: type II secretion system protein [Clostridia bacterium]|nr:type II secretion system protein [Clostridia bacterium]
MQKKKGISLIVLVITIIVMIILAAAVVISLGNVRIIDKASEVVDKNRVITIKDRVNVAILENKLAEYKGGTVHKKSDVVAELLEDGVITETEAETLKNGEDVLIIGNDSIDFSELNAIVTFNNGEYEYNGVKYSTLTGAINAVEIDNNITLVFTTNYEENMTIANNSRITKIDGKGNTYTGTITINGGGNQGTIAIKNMNFVSTGTHCIYKSKTGFKDKIIIDTCNFNGVGANSYAVNIGNIDNLVIRNCTATNWGYGLLYAPSTIVHLTAENITVTESDYGIHIVYFADCTFKSVMLDTVYGFVFSNWGSWNVTFEDCSVKSQKPVYIWERNANKYCSLTFNGKNNLLSTQDGGGWVELGKYFKVVLNDSGLDASTINGIVVKNNNAYYNQFEYAITDAAEGNTINIIADTEVTTSITIDKNITVLKGDNTFAVGTNGSFTVTAGTYDWDVTGHCAEGKSVSISDGVINGVTTRLYTVE